MGQDERAGRAKAVEVVEQRREVEVAELAFECDRLRARGLRARARDGGRGRARRRLRDRGPLALEDARRRVLDVLLDERVQLVERDRLLDERRRARRARALLVAGRDARSGEEEDGDVAGGSAQRADALEDLEAVAPRELDVDQGEIEVVGRHRFERRQAVVPCLDPVALRAERLTDDRAQVRIRIDAEHPSRHAAPPEDDGRFGGAARAPRDSSHRSEEACRRPSVEARGAIRGAPGARFRAR